MFWAWQLELAQAADGSSGQVPGALSWIDLQDSRGISVWNYEMSLDRGGITSPNKIIWSFVIDLVWGLYRSCVVIAIWFLDWAISFSWLATISTPVLALGDSLQVVVDRFGITPLLATAAALIAFTWMARGRWALGIFELFASLVIAALAVGAFANPVEKVAGDDGLIVQTRDVGLELASGMANNGNVEGDADAMRQVVTGALVDTFIRTPTQMINFGEVLDGGPCEGAYDDVIRGGPYGSEDTIRDAIAGCDENLGEAAANPGLGQATSAVILSPAALFVMVFAIVLAGAVMLAAAYALYQALRLIVTVILAILPGSARGALFQTVADLAMALVTLVFAVVFLSSYLIFIQGLFASSSDGSAGTMATFFLVDVMLVIGIVLFWKGRKKLRRAADRLTAALSTRPGAGPSALPARKQFSSSELYYEGRMAADAGRIAGRGAGALGRGSLAAGRGINGAAEVLGGWIGRGMGSPVAAGAAAGAAGANRGIPQLLAGSGRSPGAAGALPGGGSPSGGMGGGGAAGAVRQRVASTRAGRKTGGKLLALGGQVAALYLTGGASAALQAGGHAATAAAAIQTAQTARRVAVAGRLVVKALPAAASATSPSGAPLALTAGRSPDGESPGGAPAVAGGSTAASSSRPVDSRRARATSTAAPPAPNSRARGGSTAAGSATAAGRRTGSTSTGPTSPGATSSTSAPGTTTSTKATGTAAGATSSTKAPSRPQVRTPVSPVSGEVISAPAKTSPPTDDRAARLRAELAARRAANHQTMRRATGHPTPPPPD
ncbi:hypothetical protein [Modestobacter sp. DSM 44400]|uniref:hypothetical protein n=1 Tax=Modestobacter sp. DSM 44400 TaxID=1550230 RepID=UPI0011153057|nr:hypothetical protein [Modestobacter sp. DSM 44400]